MCPIFSTKLGQVLSGEIRPIFIVNIYLSNVDIEVALLVIDSNHSTFC